MMHIQSKIHLSGGVSTVPLSVLFQYKTLKENEIKERENIKSKFCSLVCRALNNLRVASAPKLPCPFGAAAGIPIYAQWKRAGPITQRSMDRNHALLPLLDHALFSIQHTPKHPHTIEELPYGEISSMD
jgi:hypothetical protein